MNETGIFPILDIKEDSIIKVMGVGGGGCNAVNYMYRQGIKDVTFLVCNTDKQSLSKSSVPAKLQLGPGWGAGGKPEKARQYAEESRDRIREALDDGTQMLFIAAGMGGGTGTGASSIIAEEAQKMEILTIGIVTIPFAFEGMPKIRKATKGIAELAAHVDAILVINNEKLKQIYPDFDFINAFSKSDDVVCNAAKSIAEIITVSGYINTDFADVYNTLKDGNVAIMNVGVANGENRITNAIYNALQSPIVNTNDVKGAKRILLQFYCSTAHAIKMQEIDQINEFVKQVGEDVEVQWGASLDETLEDSVRVTIIATGYEINDIIELRDGADSDKFIENSYKDNESKKEPKEETPHVDEEDNSELTFNEDEDDTDTTNQTNQTSRFTSSNDANTIEINFDDEEPVSNESSSRKHFFGDWMRGKR